MHSYSALPGAFFFTLLLLLGIASVTIVGKWKVYAKLGMSGWCARNDAKDARTGK